MTKLIVADAVLDKILSYDEYFEDCGCNYISLDAVVSEFNHAEEVDAIPIEYIEAKKKTLHCLIEVEVKHGDMEEAFRLERIIAVMNAIISDWRYDARLKRRWERGEE